MGGGGQNLIERGARGAQDLTLDALKNLPEPLKKPLRQAVGQVATNVVVPFGYYGQETDRLRPKSEETLELFSPKNITKTIKSILKDEPAYKRSIKSEGSEEQLRARRPLFRAYFDLPIQDEDKVYASEGKKFWIRKDTQNLVAQQARERFEQDAKHGTVRGYNTIGANYMTGQPDPWDFDFSEYEKSKEGHLSLDDFGRLFLEALGKPASLQTGGYTNPPPKEDPLSDILRLLR